MSRSRQPERTVRDPACAVVVCRLDMGSGERFDWHDHPVPQLVWASHGTLAVSANQRTWVLPSTRALWIPARVPHAVEASRGASMQSLYFRKGACPVRWRTPTPVAVGALLRELFGYLAEHLAPRSRLHAESLVFDLLKPVSIATIEVQAPSDPRARRVADALVADPADNRTLTAFGRAVGASARTLARVFLAETGITFGQWRTRVRLHAALTDLAEGIPVSTVALQVGYETPSAFVAAFRRVVGVPPGAYFVRPEGR